MAAGLQEAHHLRPGRTVNLPPVDYHSRCAETGECEYIATKSETWYNLFCRIYRMKQSNSLGFLVLLVLVRSIFGVF